MNGSGKSTLMHCLASLHTGSRGEVHIGFWEYSRVGIPVTLAALAGLLAWLALMA